MTEQKEWPPEADREFIAGSTKGDRMTAAEAMEIRERAKRLGLRAHCEECARDIDLLDLLSHRGPMTIIPASHPDSAAQSQRKEPVLGRAMEEAARRLRRSIGA